MRLFVFFDLPTNTKKERGDATRFRNALLKRGFYMLQYSVYVKLCSNHESAKNTENLVKNFAPMSGAIRTMIITEKQYSAMNIVLGSAYYQESFLDDNGNLFF